MTVNFNVKRRVPPLSPDPGSAQGPSVSVVLFPNCVYREIQRNCQIECYMYVYRPFLQHNYWPDIA
jgi:hypothetical protein